MFLSSSSNSNFSPVNWNRMTDLPQFCASLLPLLCHTSSECEFICEETLPGIACDDKFLPEDKLMKKAAASAVVCFANVLITGNVPCRLCSSLLSEYPHCVANRLCLSLPHLFRLYLLFQEYVGCLKKR